MFDRETDTFESPAMATALPSSPITRSFLTPHRIFWGSISNLSSRAIVPDNTCPLTPVPNSWLRITSVTENLVGLSWPSITGFASASIASTMLGPEYQLARAWLSFTLSTTLIPCVPEQGTKTTLPVLNPDCFRNVLKVSLMLRNLDSENSIESILLHATTRCVIPTDLNNTACSLVWPSSLKPASNSPDVESTTSTAALAMDAPTIIIGTKSR
mmetsp:Transcript_6659/g.28408  ORF Transcript_6659/g.28408 Transcript_6659/m.28408 type:complete len:214 (+) Transcript_6659:4665-5306(+)